MDDIDKSLDEILGQGVPVPVARNAPAPEAPDVDGTLEELVGKTEPATPRTAQFAAPEVNPQLAIDATLDELGPAMPEDHVAQPDPESKRSGRGIGQIFGESVERGMRNLEATPDTLSAIYSEATGDKEASVAAMGRAKAIEDSAPKPEFHSISEIYDAESFMTWGLEKLGENLPILAGTFVSSGGAGTAAYLTGRALLGSGVSRHALMKAVEYSAKGGAFGFAASVETAGTAQEQFANTGSTQPGTSVVAGTIKGAMELYTPFKILDDIIKGGTKSISGTAAKALVRESLTEGAQETTDLLANEWVRPEEYDFFTWGNAWRVADAMAAGAVVGGTIGAGGAAVGNVIQKRADGKEKTLTPEEIKEYERAYGEQKIDNPASWRNPLTWLRQNIFGRRTLSEDSDGTVSPSPKDYSEMSAILEGVRRTWEDVDATQDMVNTIREFEDSQVPRYVIRDEDGTIGKRVLTDTDLEMELAQRPPGANPQLMRVDLQSMMAGGITADIYDMPNDANSQRVYFMPGVSPQEQMRLRGELSAIIGGLNLYKTGAEWGSSDRATREMARRNAENGAYKDLIDQGLRVIPSYGAGFYYSGPLVGKIVERPTTTGRTVFHRSIQDPVMDANRTSVFLPTDPQSHTKGDPTIAPDWNKVKFEDAYVDVQPIDLSRQNVPMAPISTMLTDEHVEYHPSVKDQSLKDSLREELGLLLDQDQRVTSAQVKDLHARGIRLRGDRLAELNAATGGFMNYVMVALNPIRGSSMVRSVATPEGFAGNTPIVPHHGGFELGRKASAQQLKDIDVSSTSQQPAMQKAVAHVKTLLPVIRRVLNMLGMKDSFNIILTTNGPSMWDDDYKTLQLNIMENENAAPEVPLWGLTNLMFHELGHYVTMAWWHRLDSVGQNKIIAAWKRTQLAYHTTGQPMGAMNVGRTPQGNLAQHESQMLYTVTFVEFLTEQFVRWMYSNKQVRTDLEATLSDLNKDISTVSRLWSEHYKRQDAPDYVFNATVEFTQVMDYVQNLALGENFTKLGELVRQTYLLSDNFKFPTNLQGVADQTIQAVEEFLHTIRPGTKIQVLPGLGPDDGAAIMSGAYYPNSDIIRLWTGALASNTDPDAARITVTHEMAHAIYNQLTEAEKVLVEQTAERMGIKIPEWAYQVYNAKQAVRLGMSHSEAQAFMRAQRREEMWAYLVQERRNGRDLGTLNGWADLFWELVDRIRNLLAGHGLVSGESLVRAFYRGELARRAGLAERVERVAVEANRLEQIMRLSAANDSIVDPAEFFSERGVLPDDGGSFTLDDLAAVYNPWAKANGATMSALQLWKKLPMMRGRIAGRERIVGYKVKDPGKLPAPKRTSVDIRLTQPKGPTDTVTQPGPAANQNLGVINPAIAVGPMKPLSEQMPGADFIYNAGPGMWVVVELGDDKTINHTLFKGPGGFTTKSLPEQLDELGEMIGYVILDKRGQNEYEVDFVSIGKKFQRQGFATRLYNAIQREMKINMKPSGILTPEGYAFWQNRDPSRVKYHIKSELTKMWYSPKYVLKQLAIYERMQAQDGNAELTAQINSWKRLRARIDMKALIGPEEPASFMLNVGRNEAKLGVMKKSQEVSDNRLVKAMVGETLGATRDEFDRSHSAKSHQARVRNGGVEPSVEGELIKPLLGFGGRGGRNPKVRPFLTAPGIGEELDKVSWFSKLFFGIHQLAWRNEHIVQLRNYINETELMNAFRMEIITEADETARQWDKLPDKQRDALSDLLFWLTEMGYRSRQEVANRVTRHPTAGELAAKMQALKVGPEAVAIYNEVKQRFEQYLVRAETVLAKNIERRFSDPATGQINAAGQAALIELQRDMALMRQKPYFPMVRFGKWTITVRDGTTNQVTFFAAYATARERDAAVPQVARQHPGDALQVGSVEEEVLEFMGLPAPVLKQIAIHMPNLSTQQKDWLDRFQHLMAPDQSFKKRWLERKGTKGYSRDAFRAFSHYFLTGANYLSKLKHQDQLQGAITSLKSDLPSAKDSEKRLKIIRMVEEHHQYIMRGGKDWAVTKSFIALWQLGFSPMAAFMNLTQTPTVTLPYFNGVFGAVQSAAALRTVFKSLKRSFEFVPKGTALQFQAARQELIRQGKIDVGQAPELGSYAEGFNLSRLSAGTTAQRWYRNVSWAGMVAFGKMERLNREIAFGMAWELAMKPESWKLPWYQQFRAKYIVQMNQLANKQFIVDGQAVKLTDEEALATLIAREAIDRTQFIFQPWARPKFLRNPAMSTLMVFFGYIQSMLYAFGNNPGMLYMIGVYAALYGLMGLPGADDLEELVKAALRMAGIDFNPEKEAREFIRNLTKGTFLDQVGPDLLLHGVSRFSFGLGLIQEGYGLPQFDASANGSLGNIVPGLAEMARGAGNMSSWKEVTGDIVRDTAGAGFGQLFPLLQFLGSDPLSGDMKKWERVMPRFAKGVSKAYRYYSEERERTNQGGTLVKFDPRDPEDLATIVTQALGATPTKVSTKWDMLRMSQDQTKWYQGRKLSLLSQLDEAVRVDDSDGVKEVIARIKAFNKDLTNHGAGAMGITSDSVRSSLQTRARNRALQGADLPTQRTQIPVHRGIQELFPTTKRVK